jgi:hypothetical protein
MRASQPSPTCGDAASYAGSPLPLPPLWMPVLGRQDDGYVGNPAVCANRDGYRSGGPPPCAHLDAPGQAGGWPGPKRPWCVYSNIAVPVLWAKQEVQRLTHRSQSCGVAHALSLYIDIKWCGPMGVCRGCSARLSWPTMHIQSRRRPECCEIQPDVVRPVRSCGCIRREASSQC